MATGFPFSVIPANSCPAICGDSKSEENKCISVPHMPEVKSMSNVALTNVALSDVALNQTITLSNVALSNVELTNPDNHVVHPSSVLASYPHAASGHT